MNALGRRSWLWVVGLVLVAAGVGGEELVVRKAGARQIANWSSLAFPGPLNLADTTDARSP